MKYYVVNAFTDTLFGGNPAGVCLCDKPLDEQAMQNIAMQNNLSETAFVLKTTDGYSLRWFTPKVEIELCGHATLGTAFVLMNYVDQLMTNVSFETKSGTLTVVKENDFYTLNFPPFITKPYNTPNFLEQALGEKVNETRLSRDLLVVLENENAVINACPDFDLLASIKEAHGVIITAKGDNCDFVSRFFAPNMGINEDPVTGSAHCSLIPFWSKRLGKSKMTVRQLSKRGGVLFCEDCGERVKIGGKAVCYLKGEIEISERIKNE